jgi:hypothetical protein
MDSKPISFYGTFVPQVVRFSQVFLIDEAVWAGAKNPAEVEAPPGNSIREVIWE